MDSIYHAVGAKMPCAADFARHQIAALFYHPALQAMAEAGMAMVYDTNHIVLGKGNFVLAVSEGSFAGAHTSFYDLFRVENGKIAEHWDVTEVIPAREEWKNENGKFGFPKACSEK